ncbi:hypothetical protein [Rubritalea marina]|uniref:hypothetical protein n=1 Tax=Rubritalea marina TaxID=361055 RepID=UPI0003642FB9|nr:hypothetical protein [Rubritalea marina]
MIESFLNRLERNWSQWAIPGLIRYLAILFVGVFLASALRPNFNAALDFNFVKIAEGEYWRLITFIFAPQVGSFNGFTLLFLFFGTMLLFSFSDALEAQWGSFRTNLYIFGGYLCTLAFNLLYVWLFNAQFGFTGVYLAASILFAFALYYPKFTINLFLVIPCPIWIIAAITGAMMLLSKLSSPLLLLHALGCLGNFVAVTTYFLVQRSKQGASSSMRKRKFARQFKESSDEAFHRCHVCGATDVSHPEREFRVAADGNDYCDEHLPKP